MRWSRVPPLTDQLDRLLLSFNRLRHRRSFIDHVVGGVAFIEMKIAALRAHGSQFSDEFLANARDRWMRAEDGRYVERYRRVLMAF